MNRFCCKILAVELMRLRLDTGELAVSEKARMGWIDEYVEVTARVRDTV